METSTCGKKVFDFLSVVKNLEMSLEAFKTILKIRKTEDYQLSAHQILDMSDQIFSFCLIYLDYVHPIWIKHKRNNGEFDESQLVEVKEKLNVKLQKNEKKLLLEFNSLTRSSTEE